MGTVSAKELLASLDKARDMGLVEESFDLCGHSLVVRNLRPMEVEAVLESCRGLEDLPYVNNYQRQHVSRAIVELDGYDLREVEFIDDEEPDPKKQGSMRRIRIERHKWLADKVVCTWGPEVIFTAYRKIGDCTTKADKLAKTGVTFLNVDETPEDKYRRCLGDVSDAEDDMPETLIDKTLEEFGYIRKATMDELRAADEKLNKLRQEADAATVGAAPTPEPEAEPEPEQEPISPVARAMANRKPLNQPDQAPPPERAPPVAAVEPPATAGPPVQASTRSAQLAALEADADSVGAMADAMLVPATPVPGEIAELGGSAPRIDREAAAREASTIIDQPPVAGLNPRFRPPQR